ncbi:hypothetical protein H9P43_005636 [Blastocladiella emersonii ATCC 22665]|nr:hypothetical protein H9P43_005636 [Blastocladiella emersonii ATCC 22665]
MLNQILVATVAVMALAAASASAAVCDPSKVPAAFAAKHPVAIQPVITQFGDRSDIKAQVFGFLDYQDGCNLVLKNFTYYPDLGQTVMYGVKGEVNDTNAFPISTVPVTTSDGTIPRVFKLDSGKSMDDFNHIKIFSLQSNTVVATATLYPLSAAAGSANGTAAGSASARSAAAGSVGAGAAGVAAAVGAGVAALLL